LTPGGPSVYCGCLLGKARARSADNVFLQVPPPRRMCVTGTLDRTQDEGAMKRKKGEDGEDFDVFGAEETEAFGEAEAEEDDLYEDELEEEFDDEDADFDEDFVEEEPFEEEEEDFDGLVDDDE
jgi:hypothetical protein